VYSTYQEIYLKNNTKARKEKRRKNNTPKIKLTQRLNFPKRKATTFRRTD